MRNGKEGEGRPTRLIDWETMWVSWLSDGRVAFHDWWDIRKEEEMGAASFAWAGSGSRSAAESLTSRQSLESCRNTPALLLPAALSCKVPILDFI